MKSEFCHCNGNRSDEKREFFAGNLNRCLMRDQIFTDFANFVYPDGELEGQNLYVDHLNQPYLSSQKKDKYGRELNNVGYAFIVCQTPRMAQEMIRLAKERGGKIQIGSSLMDIKPVNVDKRKSALEKNGIIGCEKCTKPIAEWSAEDEAAWEARVWNYYIPEDRKIEFEWLYFSNLQFLISLKQTLPGHTFEHVLNNLCSTNQYQLVPNGQFHVRFVERASPPLYHRESPTSLKNLPQTEAPTDQPTTTPAVLTEALLTRPQDELPLFRGRAKSSPLLNVMKNKVDL